MKRRVTLGGNAFLVVLSVALSLMLFEFLARLFFPAYDPSGQVRFNQSVYGTVLGPPGGVFRQTKNTGDYDVEIRFNDWGLRDDKPLTSATSQSLFVVGDSFAFGWGVGEEARFSNRFQTICKHPVFNLGIGGGDFDTYSSLIRYVEAEG